MFDTILIANRGEIACRVIKTARALGIRSVAVYSDADQEAMHTKMADEAVHIGLPAAKDSYLVIEKIITAAISTGAQAIHPGYGFLSENADFAQACADNNIVFVGPPVGAIQSMGSKSAAKTIMENAGVPLVPGYHGDDQNPELLKAAADKMGYPVLLKAVAGGGGKGMRQVWKESDFFNSLEAAKRESKSSFGNDDMLVEKYLTQPRHVEVQVFCDQHSNGVYLFERDCSVQRRHQKVIEEAPAPNLSENLRQQMGQAAVRAAQAIDYVGAGTVEFLLDVDGTFYFMEMNTRLQVEHPVTEMITRQDLVEWQLRVASGQALPLSQSELSFHGHSFEARIYAEDPNNDFMPTSGTLISLNQPTETDSVRVDTGVAQGDNVSPFYDPMIAKLVVWGEDREQALKRLAAALLDYNITGLSTNISFLHTLATHASFIKADLSTGFIEQHEQSLFESTNVELKLALCFASQFILAKQKQTHSDPWSSRSNWRLNQANRQTLSITIDGQNKTITADHLENGFILTIEEDSLYSYATLENDCLKVEIEGHHYQATILADTDGHKIFYNNQTSSFALTPPDFGQSDELDSATQFTAPMNGTVVDVLVSPNTEVKQGDTLLIIEAMKMQHAVIAPKDGRVLELFYAAGDLVDGGQQLLTFDDSK